MIKTAAIICAYNEQKTIVNIIQDICKIPCFDEVIVINDGSTDKSGQLIKNLHRNLNFRDIHFIENMGKGYAMATGTELTTAEFIVFIDADLSNFTQDHANKLLNPILNGEADLVLGQPTDTLIKHGINPFKHLSGQRAVKKKDILPLLEKMKPSRYGVETLINIHYKAHQKDVKYVKLESLIHPTKFEKTNLHLAIKEFILEACQIIATTIQNIDMTTKRAKKKVLNPLSLNN